MTIKSVIVTATTKTGEEVSFTSDSEKRQDGKCIMFNTEQGFFEIPCDHTLINLSAPRVFRTNYEDGTHEIYVKH